MKWKKVKLGSLVNVLSGYAFDSAKFNNSNNGTPLIRIRDIKRGYTETYYLGEYDSSYIICKGDILIGMDGEFNIAAWAGKKALLNQRVCKITSSDCSILDEKYMLFFLPIQLKKIEDKASFVTVKHLSVKDIREIEIPLPPLSIQREIAEILDKADALRQKDQLLLQKYDELAQSIFYDMFGDPVKNEKGWEVIKLREVADLIQTGPFGSLLHVEDYVTGGIPLVNPTHIQDDKIQPDNELTVSDGKMAELTNYILQQGDVIMGRRGEMGRCAVVTAKEHGYLCGTGSIFIRLKQNFKPEFLQKLLSHFSMKKLLEKSSMGTTMNNLNQTIIGNLDIICPSEFVQYRYTKVLNSLLVQRNRILASQKTSDLLFENIISRSFS